ncbi:MAG: nuclease-related domain-containing protein [Thermodesulfobacteriota bacterium]|nr:nuclease-related domain-containing protein [Thermodesulfobacteriota bacterium]
MAKIWGDYTSGPVTERRVCEHLRLRTPSDWVVIHSSTHSYGGQRPLEFDVLLFADNNCFVIEVKGGHIHYISDEAWLISYHGEPPKRKNVFGQTFSRRNIIWSKINDQAHDLRNLEVTPLVCDYREQIEEQDLFALESRDNRDMVIPFSKLLDTINEFENKFQFTSSQKTPEQRARAIFRPFEPKLPKIGFEELKAFKEYDKLEEDGHDAQKRYSENVYKMLKPYFDYVCDRIAEVTEKRIWEELRERARFFPRMCDEAKIYNRPFVFITMIRYPDGEPPDYAQLAFNFGYYTSRWLDDFNLRDAIEHPGYVIATKAAVYKSNRPDRDMAVKNLLGNASYFLRKLKELGDNYFFLYYKDEDPGTHHITSAKDIEELGEVDFFKDCIGPYSKAISFEGFFRLTRNLVEEPESLIDFVSNEFVKLYPIYKYLHEPFPVKGQSSGEDSV